MVAWFIGMYLDWRVRRDYQNRRKGFAAEIGKQLSKRVVIIEGRCPKCDGKLPDESLAEFEGKNISSIKTEGIH